MTVFRHQGKARMQTSSEQRIAKNIEDLQRALVWADRIRERMHDDDPSRLIDACVAYDDARKQVVISELLGKEPKVRNKGAWVQTFSSQRFTPLTPDPNHILLEDIAHALSNVCRFNGHSKQFYSVAQHCVHVNNLVEGRDNKMWALFHDAAEAYLSDVPKPIKPLLPAYETLEEELLKAVAVRFDLAWPVPDEIKQADLIALATEKRDLMGPEPAPWCLNVEPDPKRIEPMPPALAKAYFSATYNDLARGN